MAEIRTGLNSFKRIASGSGNPIYESNECVVTTAFGMIVTAHKYSSKKIFKDSYPLLAIGYSGIAHWTFESKAENFLEDIADMDKDDLKAIQKRVNELLEEKSK